MNFIRQLSMKILHFFCSDCRVLGHETKSSLKFGGTEAATHDKILNPTAMLPADLANPLGDVQCPNLAPVDIGVLDVAPSPS